MAHQAAIWRDDDVSMGELDELPISFAIVDGKQQVLSRWKDIIWDFTPYHPNPVVPLSGKRINWGSVPSEFVHSLKAFVMSYWKNGIPGYTKPQISSVLSIFERVLLFSRWLSSVGVYRFSLVKPIHLGQFVAHLKFDRDVSSSRLANVLLGVEYVYKQSIHTSDKLLFVPFPNSSAFAEAGHSQAGKNISTKSIPLDIAVNVHQCAMSEAKVGKSLLDLRRAYKEMEFSQKSQAFLRKNGFDNLRKLNAQISNCVDACYLLIGLHSGIRASELGGLRAGAYYESKVGGEVCGWIQGRIIKGNIGDVEWMIHPEVARPVFEFLEAYAELQEAYVHSYADIASERAEKLTGDDKVKAQFAVHQLRSLAGGYFVFGITRVSTTRKHTDWNRSIKMFCERHGIECSFTNHQMRKTFAVIMAKTGLADILYLKQHFKHSRLEVTAGYAANDRYDKELVQEVDGEASLLQAELIGDWLFGEEHLAGGAGEYIETRRQGYAGMTSDARADLVRRTSDSVIVRSTGHSWCLAESKGCGGQGLYDSTLCSDCPSGVITQAERSIWIGMGRQQLTLRTLSDVGLGGKQKVEKSIQVIGKVLERLGVDIESLTPYEELGGSHEKV